MRVRIKTRHSMAPNNAAAAEQASPAVFDISHACARGEASQNVEDQANVRFHGEDDLLVAEQMNGWNATAVFVSGGSMGTKVQTHLHLQPAIIENTFALQSSQSQSTASAPIVYGTATVHNVAPFRPGPVDPSVYIRCRADIG